MTHKSFSPFHFYTRKAQKDPRENDLKELPKKKMCEEKGEKSSSRILCFDFLPLPPLSFHWRKSERRR